MTNFITVFDLKLQEDITINTVHIVKIFSREKGRKSLIQFNEQFNDIVVDIPIREFIEILNGQKG
jgi:hypothetical protein